MLAKHIMITGASSGLGAALAEEYAAPGMVLGLTGRNTQRLESVAETCRKKGAEVVTGVVDVTNAVELTAWIHAFDTSHPIDLCIANAGISGGTGGGSESLEQITRIFDVNVFGVLNTVTPVAEVIRQRGSGQIAMVSSIAGFRGSLAAPAYSASKAAVISYGQGLRGFLHPFGVHVSVICPGFIKTPMTDVNSFPMPFMLDVCDAARIIKLRLANKPALLAFPWQTAFIARVMAVLPDVVVDKLLRRVPAKPPSE